ncbi:NAD(P)/FAD-dependent oxidoreductase [Candidatus Dependentiae bacterium]|nr:MAG: NAD(P)/FAD-dependent oxidoreductase [Candidatus Dependentiae bacterium]
MMSYEYDVLVIGGGAGGLTASKTAHGLGKRVALLEKTDRLGGECTWTGCIPSKALIKTAEVAYHAKQLDRYGLRAEQSIVLDTSNVMPYVRSIIQDDYQSHTPEKIRSLGIDLLFGNAKFLDPHRVQLDERIITFNKAIITTGSHPFVPPIEGLDTVPYLTNSNLFNLERLPKSLIILGGGAIGAEMASALNRLGVAVTVIEMNDRILPKEDAELVAMLTDTLLKEGVTIKTGMQATKVEKEGDGVRVIVKDTSGAQHELQAEKLLVAVGRRPNIEGLGLEAIGVQANKRGIVVNNKQQTTTKNIYAAGDVVGPYQFSHMAWYQAVVAVRNMVVPIFKQKLNYTDVIWVTFTAPELASAGLTEEQAREQYGDSIIVYRKPYAEIDRAVTDRTKNGLAKFICNKKGYLLGIHILGARAGDIIHEAQVIKAFKKRFDSIHSVIHAYPTYAELTWHAAKKAYVKRLESNFFVILLKKLFFKRKK